MNDLLAARSQMAVSLGFHIVFAIAGIGIFLLLYVAFNNLRNLAVTFLNLPFALIGAVVAAPNLPGVRVIAVRLLGPRLEKEIRTETGEDVRLLQLTNWLDNVEAPMRELHSGALADGQVAARRIDRLDAYAASAPVLAATGEGVALIEVRLPAATVERSVARFLRRLALIALVLGGLAVFAGVVLGRRIARPLRDITSYVPGRGLTVLGTTGNVWVS